MNVFDIVLLAMLAISCLAGLRSGLARVVVHTAAIFTGLISAFWCYGILAGKIAPWIHEPLIARIVSFCLIFFGIVIVGSLLGSFLAALFNGIGLGWLDHLLGGAAGLVRGALLVAVLVAAILAFTPLPGPAYLAESKVLPYATIFSGVLADLAPKPIRDGFAQQLQRLKQLWLKPQSKDQRIV